MRTGLGRQSRTTLAEVIRAACLVGLAGLLTPACQSDAASQEPRDDSATEAGWDLRVDETKPAAEPEDRRRPSLLLGKKPAPEPA